MQFAFFLSVEFAFYSVPEVLQFTRIQVHPVITAAASRLKSQMDAPSVSHTAQAVGLGNRFSPFDLRHTDSSLLVECALKCSSDPSSLKWTIRNTVCRSRFLQCIFGFPIRNCTFEKPLLHLAMRQ